MAWPLLSAITNRSDATGTNSRDTCRTIGGSRQKLTLNFGLRYSYKSPIREANNQWANFDPIFTYWACSAECSALPCGTRITRRFLSTRWFCMGRHGEGNDGCPRRLQHHVFHIYRCYVDESKYVPEYSTAVSRCQSDGGFHVQCAGAPGEPTCLQRWRKYSSRLFHFYLWFVLGSCPSLLPCRPDDGLPERGTLTCGDGIVGSPCNLLSVDPNLKTPYVENFNWASSINSATTVTGTRLRGQSRRPPDRFCRHQPACRRGGYCLNSPTATRPRISAVALQRR